MTRKAPKPVTNVEVFVHSDLSQEYSLSCEYDGARYHVWQNRSDRALQNGVGKDYPTLYKNSLAEHGKVGHFSTRYLRTDSQLGRFVVAEMIKQAEAADLYGKAEAAIDERKNAKAAERREAQARERVREAAPDLLMALEKARTALVEGREYQGEVLEVIAEVEAAIAKARGQ